LIDIQHLSKNFGPVQAVRDLTLFVPQGELFCFLGPNGAGKTTTLKLLTGLLRPAAGSIRLDGIDLARDPLEAKRRIGYVPDTPFLYDRLTPEEFLRFTGDLYGLPPATVTQRAAEAFELFSLNAQAHALIKDLSHGMRQRLVYAATFLHEPRVLFIDEPLVGLDPYTIRLLKDLLLAKTRAGMTVFLTTHILALAADIADRIGIILDGRLSALGTLDELLKANGGHDLETMFLKLTGGTHGISNHEPAPSV
jgi:ABC-2 type transport system ATP-binding protein